MGKVNTELKNIIEAALLAAGEPLTVEKMQGVFPEDSRPTKDEIKTVLEALEQDYAEGGIELKKIDRSWRFQTRQKYAEYVGRLTAEKPPRYSRALLETLAIIVYRQPVTRGEIEEIRGVSVSSDIIKTLLGREWIKQVGTKDVPGHPALFGTTKEFLEHFSLTSLSDLPPLAELRDLGSISAELDQRLGTLLPGESHPLPLETPSPAEMLAEEAEADVEALADVHSAAGK